MNTQNQKQQDKDRQQQGQQPGNNGQRQDDKQQKKNSFKEGQSDNSRSLEDEEPVDERSGENAQGDKTDPEINMPADNPEKTERKIPTMDEKSL